MAQTVLEVFRNTVKKHATQPALLWKQHDQWHRYSWANYWSIVHLAARGFASLGVNPQDVVAIMGFNCPQWLVSDVAAIAAGAIPAGIYTTSSPEQAEYIINHSQSKIIVVENNRILDKILQISDKCPSLKHIVLMHGETKACKSSVNILNWSEFLTCGETYPQTEIDTRIANQKMDDVATLVYTSGTTSHPKAVMLTHTNITWTADVVANNVLRISQADIFLSYLPLSHVAEQMTTIHGPMTVGAPVYFAESLEKLPKNLLEVRPTIFLGVPRVWEKIHEKMVEKASTRGAVSKKIASWAKSIGLKVTKDVRARESMVFKAANALVYKKVKIALGLDRCRMQFTAAAPIARQTLEFFWSLNLPIYEIYGMSECSGPASICLPEGPIALGAVGPALHGTSVKIADDGEVLIKGPHVFKGYLRNAEATAACLDKDGYLHSGDLGSFDQSGNLNITGRKKDLIITSGGENIAPEMLESQIKEIFGVEHAVVVGDRQKYLSLLIALNPNDLSQVNRKIGSQATSLSELADCKVYRDYVESQISNINQNVARVQTIKSFAILPDSFSEETGELTPTMKVKRNFVIQKYQEKIAQLYS